MNLVENSLPEKIRAGRRPQTIDSLAERIDFFGENGCWLWLGGCHQGTGYGKVSYKDRTWLAHRLVWEFVVGPLNGRLVLDHLCRNRLCVNPDHLEEVTLADNLLRGKELVRLRFGDFCSKGHELTLDNVYVRCRTCATEQTSIRNKHIRQKRRR